MKHLRLNRTTKAEIFPEKIRLFHNDDENGMQMITLRNEEFQKLMAGFVAVETESLDTFAKQAEKNQG